ncbi:MAG: PEP-CTERM sorting domain-containing protein, partial [Verrucomicrobiota bacterium]
VSLKNSSTRLLLYETWARPDRIAAGYFPNLSSMQNELRASYSAAATDLGLHGWAPVGDAFLETIAVRLANDPTTALNEGPLNLWNSDNYHASAYGSYLAANVFYAKILGGDPRALPTGAGSAAAGLGLNSVYADQLQEIAYKMTQTVPEPSTVVLFGMGLLMTTRRRRAGMHRQTGAAIQP